MSAADVQVAVDAIRTVSADRHLLLLTDFDGTLCEFDPDPAAVRLLPRRRALLDRLATRAATTIAIVSGRRLDDVRSRAALNVPAYYAGLHGLEIEGPTEYFRHPDVEGAASELRDLAGALAAGLAAIPGAFVEDKGLSIAAHFREASSGDAARAVEITNSASQAAVAGGRLRVMRGDAVFELLPNIEWHKGDAVSWIQDRVRQKHGDAWPLYIGDDVTDVSAFQAVRGTGMSVSAARRAGGADFNVDGPADVERLLASLAEGWRPGVR